MINMRYTEKEIGEIVDIETKDGSVYEERIVMAFCQICASRYIGPINGAGGFLARHEYFHKWEFKMEVSEHLEA